MFFLKSVVERCLFNKDVFMCYVFASGHDSRAVVRVNCICACFYDKRRSPQRYTVTVCMSLSVNRKQSVFGEIFPSRHHEKCSGREFNVISASP